MKNTMIPDSIWINAHIQTMDDSLPSAQAFAVIWRGILFTPDLSKAICTFRCMVTAC